MKRMWLLPLGLFLALGAGSMLGCKTHAPYAMSTGGPLIKNVRTLGRVEGVSVARYYLSIIGPIGDDSLEAAVADALSKKGGDSLINVTVGRERTSYLGFVTVIRTRVTGLAVKYPRG